MQSFFMNTDSVQDGVDRKWGRWKRTGNTFMRLTCNATCTYEYTHSLYTPKNLFSHFRCVNCVCRGRGECVNVFSLHLSISLNLSPSLSFSISLSISYLEKSLPQKWKIESRPLADVEIWVLPAVWVHNKIVACTWWPAPTWTAGTVNNPPLPL